MLHFFIERKQKGKENLIVHPKTNKMKAFTLFLSLFLLSFNFVAAQSASELADQLTQDYETKYGITLTDYQRKSIKSNYYSAITKMERIQHLQATNSMMYEQQRQKIVADAELRNSRLLTGNQMRQINSGKSTSVVWPGKESTPEEVDTGMEDEGIPEEEGFEEDIPEEGSEEGSEEDWEEDEWDEGDFDSTEEGTEGEGDILDKAINKALKVDNTAPTDSSKGKKVLKKGLKFLYDELLRPALDKKVSEDGKKDDENEE